MRSIVKFVFVVVPTAALATAVVVGVSGNGHGAASAADGDLERDLKLASSTTLELAPMGHTLATVSSFEAPPVAKPDRTVRLKRSSSGPRAVRSRARVVRATPEPDVAESMEESETTEVTELAGAASETTVEAPAEGGVALPRPTATAVIFPTGGWGGGGGGEAGDIYGRDPGTVIRGGGVGDDPCRIHGRGPSRGPVYRQPRGGGITLGDRIRGVPSGQGRTGSIYERVRAPQGRSSSQASSRRSIYDRVRVARR